MKLPRSFYSWTTISGIALAFISLLLIIFMMVINLVFGRGDNYSGLFTYIVLPVFLIIGLIMIPVGAIRKMKELKKHKEEPETKLPIINLNEPAQRSAVIIFAIGSTIFLMLSALGSYEAFHYTESVPFCGTLCHDVMEPEYVAYQNSAHAR
jgi:drug/metabolite transporter (DMT)-like permease